ncbi:WhiB family transcriptional regulator [Raineyella antarctica]|uniref:WhiB family transcriptional regulator n=1 Tax=Raineyella antarctica TaxID=1577474 RepID=UPI001587FFAC|nr:WhiB family transcriptional regulator [Raineyella antarctica]
MSVSDLTIGCADHEDLYQHPLMEDDPGRAASTEQRRIRTALTRRATAICGGCVAVEPCLYRAVVEHDVAGFVAGTTEHQRKRMRKLLALSVRPDDIDALSGAPASGHQVNHAEIVRLRAQNPHMSLDTIAQRLGCSLSTVKRHLRQARTDASAGPAHPHHRTEPAPSHSDVMLAREMVLAPRPQPTAADAEAEAEVADEEAALEDACKEAAAVVAA